MKVGDIILLVEKDKIDGLNTIYYTKKNISYVTC